MVPCKAPDLNRTLRIKKANGVIVLLLAALTAGILGNVMPLGSGQLGPRPTAAWVDVSGRYVRRITFNEYDEMRVSTVVPNNTKPVSVQAVINGKRAAAFPWDVNATGYNYIMNLGQAWLVVPAPGYYSVYTVVTFSGGNKSASNNVTATITGIYVFYQVQPALTVTGGSLAGKWEYLIEHLK